jgi:hypothetical protein
MLGCSAIGYGYTYQTPNAIPKTVPEILTVIYPVTSLTVTSALGNNYTFLTPRIKFTITTTFDARGSFGANNPISVHVVISGANNTVTNYYCCVLFWNAVPASNPSDSEDNWIPLMNQGNGNYTADGILEWPDGGPTYTWLLPLQAPVPTTTIVPLTIITLNGTRPPTLTIGPTSDTLAWQDAERTYRIEVVGVGILIIGPYEVVKRVAGHHEQPPP